MTVAINVNQRDFPGGPVTKNPPFSAGNVGSIPGWGSRISHALGTKSCPPRQKAHMPQGRPSSVGKKESNDCFKKNVSQKS